MKTFRSYLTEGIAADTRQATELLVDSIYSKYVDSYSRNDEQCVGWLDGSDTVSYTHLTLPTILLV